MTPGPLSVESGPISEFFYFFYFLLKEMKTMAIEICWLDDLLKAQETAWKVNKPIFLDFYNPQ